MYIKHILSQILCSLIVTIVYAPMGMAAMLVTKNVQKYGMDLNIAVVNKYLIIFWVIYFLSYITAVIMAII